MHRVVGSSMEPRLFDGDLVLTSPLSFQTIEIGDVVVAKRENKNWIKRISSIGSGTVGLSSDNPFDSMDSRHVGSFTHDQLLGRAFAVFTGDGKLRSIPKNI